MNFYVIDDNNNRVPALDLEGVLAVLNQAIADGSLANITKDSAFVTKLKCCVGGTTHQMAFITQAKYNELKAADQIIKNCLYFILDDTTGEEMDANLEYLTKKVNELENARPKRIAAENGKINLKYDGLYIVYLADGSYFMQSYLIGYVTTITNASYKLELDTDTNEYFLVKKDINVTNLLWAYVIQY